MLWVTLGISVLLSVLVIIIHNQLVQSRQLVENGWSDIEVQLKRRADLIPRLVDTVKGYSGHERKLFSEVIEKRNAALAVGDKPDARASAESALQQPVGRLIALAEDYPELKASGNFLDLQNELSETEDKIEMSRRFYNGAVRALNTKIESIPNNFVAGPFGFKKRDYFDIDDSDYAAPKVDL